MPRASPRKPVLPQSFQAHQPPPNRHIYQGHRIDRREPAGFDTALSWAAHASCYWELPDRDYVAVAELLVRAGSPIDPILLEVAEGPLNTWLDERLADEPG